MLILSDPLSPTTKRIPESLTLSCFTGKEHDPETGNDYFGARYYSSTLGRFMTPDWAARAEPVPYAEFGDPQSLNLYAYVRNNPVYRVDVNGHQCGQNGQTNCDTGKQQQPNPGGSQNPQNSPFLQKVKNNVGALTKPAQPVAGVIQKLPEVKTSVSVSAAGLTVSTDGSKSLGPTLAGASANASVTVNEGKPIGEVDVGLSKHTAATVTFVQTEEGKSRVGDVGMAVGAGFPELPVSGSLAIDTKSSSSSTSNHSEPKVCGYCSTQ